MFVPYIVFLALLTKSACQSGIPRYIQGQWMTVDDNPQYEGTDEQSLPAEDRIWAAENAPEVVEVVNTVEDQKLQTTPEPNVMKAQQDSNEGQEEEGSSAWKVVLVAVVLVVSVVGSLSVGYYMCVWRGGRIHYQPQKGNDA